MRQQVSVSALIDRCGAVLVLRRSQKESFLPGIFGLPGGKVEFGESPEMTIRREIAEETSLQVTNAVLVGARSYLTIEGSQHNVELLYFVRLPIEKSTVLLSDAHEEYRWIRADEVDQLYLPDGDPIKVVLQDYFSCLDGPELQLLSWPNRVEYGR